MDGLLEHLDKVELILIEDQRDIAAELVLVQQLKASSIARMRRKADGLASAAVGLAPAASAQPKGDVFAVPKKDPVSGEPVYDPRVVLGHATHRQRVRALTRVYGPVIRGCSAGRAIFEAGETNAANIASATANLNVLAKHRASEFSRDGGTYTYHGDVEPDLEMIALVSGEVGSDGENNVSEIELRTEDANVVVPP